jgi:2,3-bisphosphoglycerate-dependent phosphoglycerate mutase
MMYTLVLLRHGQSIWNRENRFTGWMDVPLTELGVQEARSAAKRMQNAGFSFDQAFTSVLRRAVDSLCIVQEEMDLPDLLVAQTWALNERHYGCLQGLNKAETARRLGQDRVMHWRRSYTGRPPALEWDDHRHPRFDPRYSHLPPEQLPRSESLKETVDRLLPFWNSDIAPAIRNGCRALILAHGNSLRALIKFLEDVPEADVPAIQVPTGVPLIYELNLDLRPIRCYDLINSS